MISNTQSRSFRFAVHAKKLPEKKLQGNVR